MQATIVENVPRIMHFDSPTEFPDAVDITLAAFASWRETDEGRRAREEPSTSPGSP